MLIGESGMALAAGLTSGDEFSASQLAIAAGIMTLAVYLEASKKTMPFLRLMAVRSHRGRSLGDDFDPARSWLVHRLGAGAAGHVFVGGVPKRWLIAMLIVARLRINVPLVVNLWPETYQYSRITTFLNPDLDPQEMAGTSISP